MANRTKSEYSLLANVVATLKMYWSIARLLMISYVALAILQVVSSILIIFFTSRIIGELSHAIQGQVVTPASIYKLLALNALAILAERFAWRWLNLVERQSWVKWYVRISLEYHKAVARLDIPQHHDSEFQKVLIKLNEQYSYTPQNFANYILQLFHASARLLSTLVIMVGFAPWLVPIMLVSLIPGFVTERWLSKLQWNLWGEKGDKNRLAWRITAYLTFKDKIQETKIFGTDKFLLGRLNDLHQEFYSIQLKNLRKVQGRAFLSLLSEMAVLVGIMVWLIRRVLAGTLDLAGFSFYSGIITQFGSSLGLIVNSLAFLSDSNEYMRDFFKLMNTEPILPQPVDPFVLPATIIPTIEFKNVSFKYPEASDFSLKDVSFVIKPGDKIAFVGENGAGKTTVIKLLLRFYDVTKGQILVDGIDVRELNLESYYYHIGVLFQNFNDYPFSVRDNIALGRIDDFDNNPAIHEAAESADAAKFIEKYPKRYNQLLEVGFKDGIEPSGGQWQRIALARALFRDAGILILDEPTAAIDANSEYAIFKTLAEHSTAKTTIIISHRFSTVRTAKTIFVIKDGVFTEHGTHHQLMNIQDGVYKEMFEKQAEGYQ